MSFSLPQNVEGTPILELNSGSDAVGLYVSGGSSYGVLTFLYTISEGDSTSDLDTNGENSLLIPEGSSIKVGTSARSISQTCRGAGKFTHAHKYAHVFAFPRTALFSDSCCLLPRIVLGGIAAF